MSHFSDPQNFNAHDERRIERLFKKKGQISLQVNVSENHKTFIVPLPTHILQTSVSVSL